MADTTFIDRSTPIVASWLNDVNSLVYKDVINVKNYGAVGDGVTNNVTAFLQASAALTNNSVLYIPSGDYVFDFSTVTTSVVYPSQGLINLASKSSVTIFGNGSKLRITNLDTRTKGGWSIIWLNESSDITIDGIEFDIRGVTGLDVAVAEPNYPIISCVGALGTTWKNLTVKNCEFNSFNPLGADNNSAGTVFSYKQIPVFAQGDSSADTVRGFRIVDCVFKSINTYKVFYLGVGGVEVIGNKFLDTSGVFPGVRALIHASRGHTVVGNHFEGLKPTDDVPANNIQSTDTPAMVWVTNATNKGGGGVTISGNTFALTGSGGIVVGDCSGAAITGNTFWDRVDMSSKFLVEDDTKACIRLNDEASGAGSFPARDVTITGNTVSGTVLRKIIQVTHSLDGVISGNSIESARGYAIKAAKARRYTITNNIINSVASFGGAQEFIFVNTGVVSDTEPVAVVNNTMNGTAGTGVSTSSYTSTRLKISNNRSIGGISAKTAGAQDQFATDFLTFSNDATRVSSNVNDLDWYEEGTFTPTVVGVSTAGVGTYTTQIGHFTRIGDTVSFDITVIWTAHTGTGNTEIGGLPYASRNTANKITPVNVFQSGGPIPGANKQRIAIMTNNVQRVALREFDFTTGIVGNSNAITATGSLYISGVYKV